MQTITTSAPHVNMVQSVAIVALPVGYSITGGSFRLGLDLSVYGLGFVNTPIPIQFNAIGKKIRGKQRKHCCGKAEWTTCSVDSGEHSNVKFHGRLFFL